MTKQTDNPYEAVSVTQEPVNDGGRFFKRFVIAIFSFFMAFWAGALTLFFCAVLHEKGFL